jgi:hypothetical protein
MTVNAIYGNVDHTVILGAGYSSSLLVGSGASVRPGDENPADTYTGIASLVQNATLTNLGFVAGSYGLTEPGHGGNGGIGVNLALTGDTLINDYLVMGGDGGSSTGSGYYGNYGGSGGTGANLFATDATSANHGRISGGNGGNGSLSYGGGAGGVGVDLSGGTLNNTLNIEGGNGGYSKFGGFGAAGGTGVVVGNGGILDNLGGSYSASIRGGVAGAAYRGGEGGTGVDLAAGATLNNGFEIYGGSGASTTAGKGAKSPANGGDGGAGVHVATGATATLTSSSKIIGGYGGSGYLGGNGGSGLTADAQVVLSNAGTIEGGTGGWGYSGEDLGIFGFNYAGGTGGAGVVLTNAFLLNSGTISGGAGGKYGQGGIGVYLDGGTLINEGTISGGEGPVAYSNYAVKFGPKGGTLVVDSTAHFSATYDGTSAGIIGGFAPGDTINIVNMTPAEVSALLTPIQFDHVSTYYATLTTPTEGSLTLDLTAPHGSTVYGETFSVTSNGGTGTDITVIAACYLRGTHITTAEGERPIESLAIGDLVKTYSGQLRPIRWIGRRRYSRASVAANRELSPVRIRTGALAAGMPRRDLYVSPGHAMYLDGMLLSARDLVNGISILQEPWHDEVSYYHVEFDSHDIIVAEGALSESFADEGNRRLFDNGADGGFEFAGAAVGNARLFAPRVDAGEALEAVRRALLARAVVGGRVRMPEQRAGTRATIPTSMVNHGMR